MDAETINSLIKVLGHTYEKLLAEGLALGSSPTPLFPEGQNEDLIQKPAPGVELWFCAENRKLERTVITLSPIFNDDPVYEGELPKPFTRKMDQDGVRALMGEPYQSKGPVKLPPPIGITGGWDAYRIDHTNAEVVVQYLKDKSACGLAFCLIDKGSD
ncbi:DUF6392 family protein [Pseudomonas saxonica]|uniref:Immunity protein n=1 Tax=Pseudomonas saxonica TaxID=2600598 RepID=A0A5C5PSC8_9PSED|nr:DUF6392 family protein [Pseudomonas saxonica]TWR82614.1 immunity protein [Pseudomonas saxonica]WRQ73892.1 DUF6392 family protein [Pseudomonas saxonica]